MNYHTKQKETQGYRDQAGACHMGWVGGEERALQGPGSRRLARASASAARPGSEGLTGRTGEEGARWARQGGERGPGLGRGGGGESWIA